MILRLRNPTAESIETLLDARATSSTAFAPAGASRADLAEAPPGFRLDRHETVLGRGRDTFNRAVAALERGEHYPASFTRAACLPSPLEPGGGFATVATHFGFHSIHPCRILYVIREPDSFGYGFGTLPGHAEAGEERFLVEMDGDEVRYGIQAFSRPNGLLSTIATPVARRFQLRFFRESLRTMETLLDGAPISAVRYPARP